MNLKILGCAPVVQDKTCYNCSGYLLDGRVLMDIGPGIWKSLCQEKIRPDALSLIMLSHFHIDHISDLAPFLMAWFLTDKPKDQPLRLAGPAGLLAWFDRYSELLGTWSRRLPLQLIELGKSQLLAGYEIITAPTGHTDNSICFRLNDTHGKSVFYSGDCDKHPELVRAAKKSDLAIVECSNLEETKSEGHLTPQQAGDIAQEAAVQHLVLTHMYPEVHESDAVSLAALNFQGKISIAYDGFTIEI